MGGGSLWLVWYGGSSGIGKLPSPAENIDLAIDDLA